MPYGIGSKLTSDRCKRFAHNQLKAHLHALRLTTFELESSSSKHQLQAKIRSMTAFSNHDRKLLKQHFAIQSG